MSNNKPSECYNGCGQLLKFDKNVLSKTGKMIPLNLDGTKHQCPNSKWNKDKAEAEAIMAQDRATAAQQSQSQGPTRYESSYLVPKEDWEKLCANIAGMSIDLEKLPEITAKLFQLDSYYNGLVDQVKTLTSIIKHDQQLAAQEEEYDTAKEDGTVNL